MNLEQLHDIEGLDIISKWPLAIGWWALIAFGIFVLFFLIYMFITRMTFKRSWKHDALVKLSSLEKNLSDETANNTIIVLSEYLRRIALKKFPRKECAGLTGHAWLKWLSQHDPKQFDWEKKGLFLIDIPYAPANKVVPSDQVINLIQAVRNWVR